MDCDGFVLCVKINDTIEDLQNLNVLFVFNNVNKIHELFNRKKIQ